MDWSKKSAVAIFDTTTATRICILQLISTSLQFCGQNKGGNFQGFASISKINNKSDGGGGTFERTEQKKLIINYLGKLGKRGKKKGFFAEKVHDYKWVEGDGDIEL